ncbi:winged helix-turn-helix transcriptional regulator [Hymenobacter weizhouensis]|uniref:winged helix-turn-helix transcriptional regulator n=1 Tax=Hymenobacter sp. YIM 151500-1 TaxID=2987689 RepID=UPI00222738AF|nr:helix-turn-helix domain-containing protein [Hymenobacter sp. YIM 151500-1]UYZ62451.1 helix-turn-helix transcriptional regulator [Hymenobacter sp. YIM 151500-1]
MKKTKKAPVCAITAALDVLGGKWKVFILSALAQRGTLRFGELQRQIPRVTQKMLTQQLRELEDAGLVHRRIYAEVPPRVEYSLTPHGLTLRPVLTSLRDWGQLHQQVLGEPTAPTPCAVAEIPAVAEPAEV